MWITLDGLVAGLDDSMDWLRVDDQMMEYEQALVDNASTLLLGRITFSDFAGYWPDVAMDDSSDQRQRAYALRLNELEKVVISEVDSITRWDTTKRLSKIDEKEIIHLKEQYGKDIIIYGSLSIVNALAELGLIDEYHLLVHPLYLRKGKPLFQKDGSTIDLKPLSSEIFHSGVILMKYGKGK